MAMTRPASEDELLVGFLRLLKADRDYLFSLVQQQVDAAEKLLYFQGKGSNPHSTSITTRLRDELADAIAPAHDGGHLSIDVAGSVAWFAEAVDLAATRQQRLAKILAQVRSVLSNTRQRCYGIRMVHPTPNLGFGLGQPTRVSQVSQLAYEFRTRFAKLLGGEAWNLNADWRPTVTVTIDPVVTPSFADGGPHIYVQAPLALILMPRYRPTIAVEVGHWFAQKLLRSLPTELRRLAHSLKRKATDVFERYAPGNEAVAWFADALLHEVTVDTLSLMVVGEGFGWAWLAQSLAADPIAPEEARKVPHLVRTHAQSHLLAPDSPLLRLSRGYQQRVNEALAHRTATARIESSEAWAALATEWATALQEEYRDRAKHLAGERDPITFASQDDTSREPKPDWFDQIEVMDRCLETFGVELGDFEAPDEPATLSEHLWIRTVLAHAATPSEHDHVSHGRLTTALTHCLQPRENFSLCLHWLKPSVRSGAPVLLPPKGWSSSFVVGDYNHVLWAMQPGSWKNAETFPETENNECFSQREYLLAVGPRGDTRELDQVTLATELLLHRKADEFVPRPEAVEKFKAYARQRGGLFASNGWGDGLLLCPTPTRESLREAVTQLWESKHESISRLIVPQAQFDALSSMRTPTAELDPRLGVRVFARGVPGEKAAISRALLGLDPRCVCEWVAGHDDLEIDVPLLAVEPPDCLWLLRHTLRLLVESKGLFTYDCRLHLRHRTSQ